MTESDDDAEGGRVLRFPQSRTRIGPREPARDLGLSALTRLAGADARSARGHWCSRCRGIWYSCFLEAECPVCGNRHG
ncbi:hypothetical protein LNKW23_07020 [Paralimibaculum aggregatum]|uniref:Uncharacterized protein n=1 Tax=Paralimibaculum aggregatum TaxID=3036245 RepID=A0ABQ6LHA0_9RHOB|nr:hypothetical protein [Limibaculum sp. NKW23]GMG81489.1 hypothetical protein LNKW23_07020 [Limibaculum sp. NKW23]